MSSKALTKHQANPLAEVHKQYDEGKFHVLLPRVHMGRLPVGTQLAVREVRVDPRDGGDDVYKVDGGKVALSKVALNRIAAAAGITWQSVERTDPRGHPHYCEFTARGRVTDFDGTVREAVGTKTVDLREDCGDGTAGKDYTAIVSQAKRNRDPAKRDPTKRLEGARQFIAEVCASKAMNRAVADVLAIKRSYKPAELAKPFIVPKLVPDTSYPETQRAVVAGMLGASQAFYGAAPASKVVDAAYENGTESAQTEVLPSSSGGEEPGGDPSPSPSSSDLFADGPSEPELTGTQHVVEAVTVAWSTAKQGGMSADAFRELCKTQTGCQSKAEMTLAQAKGVIAAVEAYIANSDESVPI